jgi:RecB family endonuclease NucS
VSEILKQFQTFWGDNALTFPIQINKVEKDTIDAVRKEVETLQLDYKVSEKDSLSFINRIKNVIARQYDEAAYSLFLLAFVQKIVNSHAIVWNQVAQGRGSVDISICFKGRQYLIEVKLHGQKSREESLEQLSGYLDTSREKEAWLVVFDRKRDKSWEEKLTWETTKYKEKIIHIVGC